MVMWPLACLQEHAHAAAPSQPSVLPASGASKTVKGLTLQEQQQQQEEVNSSWQYEKGCWEAFHARDNATARFYKERRSGSASLVHARILLAVAHSGVRCAEVVCKQSVVAQLLGSCGSAEHMLIPLVVNCFACCWCYVVCIETPSAQTWSKMQLALVQLALCTLTVCACFGGDRISIKNTTHSILGLTLPCGNISLRDLFQLDTNLIVP